MTMSTPTSVQQYASLESFTHPDEMSYQSRPIQGRRDLARGHACLPAPETPRLLVDKPALSIRQPWAWAILHAGKDVENRSWSTGVSR